MGNISALAKLLYRIFAPNLNGQRLQPSNNNRCLSAGMVDISGQVTNVCWHSWLLLLLLNTTAASALALVQGGSGRRSGDAIVGSDRNPSIYWFHRSRSHACPGSVSRTTNSEKEKQKEIVSLNLTVVSLGGFGFSLSYGHKEQSSAFSNHLVSRVRVHLDHER